MDSNYEIVKAHTLAIDLLDVFQSDKNNQEKAQGALDVLALFSDFELRRIAKNG